jgi:protein-tyrosine phosphatase
MAEALLRHHLHAAELPLPVSSAGILGWNSSGATDHTLTALAERGVALDGHVSRRINFDLIDEAALVLTMTNDHADAVRLRHPEAAARTFVLGQLVRLAERYENEHGPRDDQPFSEWLAEVDALRDTRRRALPRDEIRDPLGEPLPAYQDLAAQLDDLTARLARLITGFADRPEPNDAQPAVGAGITVGQDGSVG